jgi:pimeloyl-ACP methyl ester carboxylesterase
MRRWTRLVAALAVAGVLVGAGPAVAGAASSDAASSAPLDGRVAISPTREMHITGRGTGSPTVVLIAGGVNSGAIWSMPYDFDKPGPTVFDEVAKTTRVCAYDRPNTASPAPNDGITLGSSTPVAGAVTPANGVVDLQRLLKAAKVPGPYVLVAHSYGGLIARLFASTAPKQVAGLVLIDSPSERFYDRLTVAEQEMWVRANSGAPAFPNAESFNFPAAFAEMRAARKPPRVPAVVFTSDKVFDYADAVAAGTLGAEYRAFGPRSFRKHVAAQRELAEELGARLIEHPRSGHYVFVERPRLVIRAIRRVVREVRRSS